MQAVLKHFTFVQQIEGLYILFITGTNYFEVDSAYKKSTPLELGPNLATQLTNAN